MARYKHLRHTREVSAPIEVLFYSGKHSTDQQNARRRLRRTVAEAGKELNARTGDTECSSCPNILAPEEQASGRCRRHTRVPARSKADC